MIFRQFGICVSALLLAACAHAAPVGLGALSSNDDGSTMVIADSLNNREWLRLDRNMGLNYIQTLEAIGSGGQFDGFQIADAVDARLFLAAGLQSAPQACPLGSCELTLTEGFTDALLGNNFALGIPGVNVAMFLGGGAVPLGIMAFAPTQVGVIDSYHVFAAMDVWAANGVPSSFLLYRDFAVNNVPEPASIALLGWGLAAMAAARRRKQA